jgi:hypothetical protein
MGKVGDGNSKVACEIGCGDGLTRGKVVQICSISLVSIER